MLGLEPGWHDHAYPTSFEWDKTRFPDPKAFLVQLEAQNVRAHLWFNPCVSPTAPLYKKLLPYAGSHLVWNGIVPDYSIAAAPKVFADHLEEKVVGRVPRALGGFKVDEVDGYDHWLWPDLAEFPSGLGRRAAPADVWIVCPAAADGSVPVDEPPNAGAGSRHQRRRLVFPVRDLQRQLRLRRVHRCRRQQRFRSVLWSPEVRGGEGVDMLRRTQAVCFSPLALFNGWATSTKLWTHAEVADHIRDAIKLRLLPYWYTAFAQYHFEGTPVVRPMPLISGSAGAGPEVKDQYMIGDALLVAPIAPGAKTRTVVLPPGKWFGFHTGRLVGENQKLEVTPATSETPVFVKDGGRRLLRAAPRRGAPARSAALRREAWNDDALRR